jgi:hypothetical protein
MISLGAIRQSPGSVDTDPADTPIPLTRLNVLYQAKNAYELRKSGQSAGNNRAVSTAMVSSFLNAAGKLGR